MPRKETLRNVPANKLEQITESFRASGATNVVPKNNGDGTFDVTATFPSAGDD